MLAEMDRALRLEPSPPRAPERVRLADLMARRDDLSDMRRREANRLKQARDAWVRKDIKTILQALERRLVRVGAEINAQIEANEILARAAAPSRLWWALRRMLATAGYFAANGGSGAAAPRCGAASTWQASSQADTIRDSGHSENA